MLLAEKTLRGMAPTTTTPLLPGFSSLNITFKAPTPMTSLPFAGDQESILRRDFQWRCFAVPYD